jgi:hypothetical protein
VRVLLGVAFVIVFIRRVRTEGGDGCGDTKASKAVNK